jgi:hypothetical protein
LSLISLTSLTPLTSLPTIQEKYVLAQEFYWGKGRIFAVGNKQ